LSQAEKNIAEEQERIIPIFQVQQQIHRGIPLDNRDPNTKIMKFRSAVLGYRFESPRILGKIEHANGLKM